MSRTIKSSAEKGAKSTHETIISLLPMLDDALKETDLGNVTRILQQAIIRISEAEATLQHQKERIRQLESLANCDELTGIHNRRGFMAQMERELSRTKRGSSQGGVLVMFDLDRFKQINDTFGHAAGDACLQHFAGWLTDTMRNTDVVARLGGDEFAALLVDTVPSTLEKRLDFLTRHIRMMEFEWKNGTIPYGASLGWAGYQGNDKAEDVMARADLVLYAGKRHSDKKQELQTGKVA